MKRSGKKKFAAAIAVLLSGVLFTGIGAGAMFMEYAGLKIVDISEAEGFVKTETLTYNVDMAEGKKTILELAGCIPDKRSLRLDDSIPVGELRIEVKYNSDRISPDVDFYDMETYIEDRYEYSPEYYLDNFYELGYAEEYYSALQEEQEGLYGENAPLNERKLIELSREIADEKREELKSEYSGCLRISLQHNEEDSIEAINKHKDSFLEGIKKNELYVYSYVPELLIRANSETMEYVENHAV